MKKILLSLKPEVYEKIISNRKIYEHRYTFPDEEVKAYLYVSAPIKAITGILYLGNKTSLEKWQIKYSYDKKVVERIKKYMKNYRYVMQINEFRETNMITLDELRKNLDRFIVPQMYYYLDNIPLLRYLEENIRETGYTIINDFRNVSDEWICKS